MPEWDKLLVESHGDNFNVLVNLVTHPEGVKQIILDFYKKRLSQGICCTEANSTSTTDNLICRSAKQELARGAVGVVYLMETPSGMKLILKESNMGDTHITVNDEPPVSIANILKYDHIKMCYGNVDIDNTVYWGVDEFTNESLIAYMLDYTFTHNNLWKIPRMFTQHYSSSVCKTGSRKFGINLMEFCDMGSLKEFGRENKTMGYTMITPTDQMLVIPDHLRSILLQVCTILDFTQKKLNFVSGDLKTDNILLSSEPLEYTYRNVPITGQFTCKLSDYGKSSCALRLGDSLIGVPHKEPRIYGRTTATNVLSWMGFDPDVKEIDGIVTYSVSSTIPFMEFAWMRHMGFPFFSSYDLYTIMISLMSDPYYRNTLKEDTDMYEAFWVPLWISPEVADVVMERLERSSFERMYHSIQFLKPERLRCDALENVWNRVHEIYGNETVVL